MRVKKTGMNRVSSDTVPPGIVADQYSVYHKE